MITEIVLFRLPDGMKREEAIAKYRLSIPTWQANPDQTWSKVDTAQTAAK